MKHPRRYVNCGPIVELKPVLEKWCDLNRDFNAKLKEDCPWWYNERASISILAAAAWQTAGFYALEEFSITKGRKRADSERPGRCDLKIWTRSKNGLSFEAKQAWCKLDKGIDLKRKYDDILKIYLANAKADAKRLKTRMGRRFGICFISPRIVAKEKDILAARLDELLDLLERRQQHDAIAWFFVEDPSLLVDKDTGRLYPGTIILLKEVKK